MKLIKISDEHFIIVDLSVTARQGEYSVTITGKVKVVNLDENVFWSTGCPKITHSTVPLLEGKTWNGVKMIPLRMIKELIGEKDLWEIATGYAINRSIMAQYPNPDKKQGFYDGYNRCLEDNKEKKYTQQDLVELVKTLTSTPSFITDNMAELMVNNFLKTKESPTEWDVEFVDGKIKLV